MHEPDDRDEVEDQELAALVEFGVLDLGQVQLAVQFVQQVFLDHGVHHNADEKVEEHQSKVLNSPSVLDGRLVGSRRKQIARVVRHHHEQCREGSANLKVVNKISMRCVANEESRTIWNFQKSLPIVYLEEQSEHEDHRYAGHDVRMVLDEELMAEDRWVLGRARSTLDWHYWRRSVETRVSDELGADC